MLHETDNVLSVPICRQETPSLVKEPHLKTRVKILAQISVRGPLKFGRTEFPLRGPPVQSNLLKQTSGAKCEVEGNFWCFPQTCFNILNNFSETCDEAPVITVRV